MNACRCWVDTYALGHDGHCCFVHGDRKINNGFRSTTEICHVPKTRRPHPIVADRLKSSGQSDTNQADEEAG